MKLELLNTAELNFLSNAVQVFMSEHSHKWTNNEQLTGEALLSRITALRKESALKQIAEVDLENVIDWLDSINDMGPHGAGWKSDNLLSLIRRLQDALL